MSSKRQRLSWQPRLTCRLPISNGACGAIILSSSTRAGVSRRNGRDPRLLNPGTANKSLCVSLPPQIPRESLEVRRPQRDGCIGHHPRAHSKARGRGGKIGRNGCSSVGRTLFVRPYANMSSLPAVNSPTYSYTPWHDVPVGSSTPRAQEPSGDGNDSTHAF